MLKNLTGFEKKFLLSNFFVYCVDFIFLNIFNFYIWEKSNSLNSVFLFNIFQAISVIFSTYLAAILIQKFPPKLVRIVGIFLFIPFVLISILSSEPTLLVLFFNGMFLGANFGFRSQSYSLMFRNSIKPENRSLFDSWNIQLSNIRLILLPVSISFLVNLTDSYIASFILGFVFIIFSAVPLIFAKSNGVEENVEFTPQKTFNNVVDKKEIFKILQLKFLEGVNLIFGSSILSIITLYILGDLGKWAIFSSITLLAQILLSNLIGSKLKLKSSPTVLGVITFLYITGALILSNYFNFAGILSFTLLSIPFNALYFTSAMVITEKEIDFNLIREEFSDEVYAFLEFARSLGKILPLVILLVLNPDFENDLILRITVLAFGIAAFLIFTLSTNIYVVKRKEDPFLNAD